MVMDTAERRNISAAIVRQAGPDVPHGLQLYQVDLAGGSFLSARVERPTWQVEWRDAN